MACSRASFAILFLLSFAPGAVAQEVADRPIRLEIGGSPGGGTFFIGGDDNTEVNFNVYTFGGFADYYLSQQVAVEADYTFGVGWGQDILFRNGLIPGQQVPFSNIISGSVLFYPKGTSGGKLPFYVSGGIGSLALVSRNPTVKLGYDPDTIGTERFMTTHLGAGVKMPRTVTSPNWGFRIDYRFMFISENEDAPAFFASSSSRKGHHIQFAMLYSFRR